MCIYTLKGVYICVHFHLYMYHFDMRVLVNVNLEWYKRQIFSTENR